MGGFFEYHDSPSKLVQCCRRRRPSAEESGSRYHDLSMDMQFILCRHLADETLDSQVGHASRHSLRHLETTTSFTATWYHWKWETRCMHLRGTFPRTRRSKGYGIEGACYALPECLQCGRRSPYQIRRLHIASAASHMDISCRPIRIHRPGASQG